MHALLTLPVLQSRERLLRSPSCPSRPVRARPPHFKLAHATTADTPRGTVYEKRLLLKYLEEHGKEPNTDNELDPEHDLVTVQRSSIVAPRPPNFTSVPSVLKALQNEWDAVVLRAHDSEKHVKTLREELAVALYERDASIRVIARLSRELESTRSALAHLSVKTQSQDSRRADATAQEAKADKAAGDDPMVIDEQPHVGLPAEYASMVEAKQLEYVVRPCNPHPPPPRRSAAC